MTKRDDQPAGLNEKSLRQAVLYILQLAVEWEIHGAEHEGGALLLARLVSDLEKHRLARQAAGLTAGLVTVRREILKLVVPGNKEGSLEARDETLIEIGRLLCRAGVRKTTSEIQTILGEPLRKGAVDGSSGDKLNDKLAKLAGVMQTSFRNEVQVMESEREKTSTGKRHTRHDTERAAMDQDPDEVALLAYALHVLDIEKDTRKLIFRECEPQWIPSYLDGEVAGAKAIGEARRVKARKAGSAPELEQAQPNTVLVPPWLELALPRRRAWWLPVPTKPSKIDVLPADLPKLTRWAKASDARGLRARAVLQLADGQGLPRVSTELGIDFRTLCLWKAAYRRGGPDALALAGTHEEASLDKVGELD